jgi:UDP-N-acetylglucosamine 2-epimerase (non-hydrolysing)
MSDFPLKVLSIVGTRPDTIKLAPLITELSNRVEIDSYLCGSGQHREMLDQALKIFNLIPDIDLNVMSANQTLDSLSSKLLIAFGKLFSESHFDVVIVHGDTTTAFCGALSAFYHQIPVIHIEAGLRTNSISEPFPEEFNRQAIARIAALNFAPTETAASNLIREGVPQERIIVSGNTVIDSLRIVQTRILEDSVIGEEIASTLSEYLDFNYISSDFVLVTMHRRENIGDGIIEVCEVISKLSVEFREIKFILPVHLNPAVGNDVKRVLSNHKNIYLLPPLAYLEFVALLSNAMLIITDSGGIQEEAVSLGKRALVTRNMTERGEGVDTGLLEIVATDGKKIFQAAKKIINEHEPDRILSNNPYGSGNISKKIADEIIKHFRS